MAALYPTSRRHPLGNDGRSVGLSPQVRPPEREAHAAEERVVPRRTITQHLPIFSLPKFTAALGRREGLVAILTKSNALDGPNLTNSRRHLVYQTSRWLCTQLHGATWTKGEYGGHPNKVQCPGRTKSHKFSTPSCFQFRSRGALAFLFYHPSRRHCTILHYLASHLLLPHFTAALLSFI